MNDHYQLHAADEANGVPALLAILIGAIADQDQIRIVEGPDRSLKIEMVLLQVRCVFGFVPFESHPCLGYHET